MSFESYQGIMYFIAKMI